MNENVHTDRIRNGFFIKKIHVPVFFKIFFCRCSNFLCCARSISSCCWYGCVVCSLFDHSFALAHTTTARLASAHTHTHTHAHTHTHTQNKQGKVRLSKWFSPFNQKDRARVAREVSSQILYRNPKMCNFLEWKDKKIVFRRCDAKRCCCVILLCLLSSVVRVVSSSARRRR